MEIVELTAKSLSDEFSLMRNMCSMSLYLKKLLNEDDAKYNINFLKSTNTKRSTRQLDALEFLKIGPMQAIKSPIDQLFERFNATFLSLADLIKVLNEPNTNLKPISQNLPLVISKYWECLFISVTNEYIRACYYYAHLKKVYGQHIYQLNEESKEVLDELTDSIEIFQKAGKMEIIQKDDYRNLDEIIILTDIINILYKNIRKTSKFFWVLKTLTKNEKSNFIKSTLVTTLDKERLHG